MAAKIIAFVSLQLFLFHFIILLLIKFYVHSSLFSHKYLMEKELTPLLYHIHNLYSIYFIDEF